MCADCQPVTDTTISTVLTVAVAFFCTGGFGSFGLYSIHVVSLLSFFKLELLFAQQSHGIIHIGREPVFGACTQHLAVW